MSKTSKFTYEANSSTLLVDEEPSLLGITPIFPEYPLVPTPTHVAKSAPAHQDAVKEAWKVVNEFRNAIRGGALHQRGTSSFSTGGT